MKKLNKKSAFTLVEIMIVVLIIGILMAIAVPNFVKARESARANSCVATLKQIDSAKEQYAMAAKLNTGDAVTLANLYVAGASATNYLKINPTCPSGGAYTVNVVGTNPACSIGGLHVLPN